VPELFADHNHILFHRGEDPRGVAEKIATALVVRPAHADGGMSAEDYVARLFEQESRGSYGGNLVSKTAPPRLAPENEGLILIKPGGTFYRPCLLEIFRRILNRCRIRQLRLYDGLTVSRKKLFERLYSKQTGYADGTIPLDEEDFRKIRAIYAVPEFKNGFGTPYSDELVTPAMRLCRIEKLDPQTITEVWEEGRREGVWYSGEWNGLNKIGYQRSVFPIRIKIGGRERVYILLNGYIPGLRKLFTEKNARLVAVHVVTGEDWPAIRRELAGEESDPRACAHGSIRNDAYRKVIELDPRYVRNTTEPVNGQRNVCHASATTIDAFRELVDWFDYRPREMVLGKLFHVLGQKPGLLLRQNAGALADWSCASRDENSPAIPEELQAQIVRERLQGHVSTARWIEGLAGTGGIEVAALKRVRGVGDYVENWRRLEVGGDSFFLKRLDGLVGQIDSQINAEFAEISRLLREWKSSAIDQGVRAMAYQVAVGDLLWLQLAIFKGSQKEREGLRDFTGCAFPQLFHARMLTDLPQQAIDCALRIRSNLAMEARASEHGAGALGGEALRRAKAWAEFTGNSEMVSMPEGGTIGLVLCGGRSTRMVSTIPKAILPLHGRFLFDWARTKIQEATATTEVFAATGFRSELIELAIGNRSKLLRFAGLLGVGFRAAACLHSLRRFRGVVVMMYCDMPEVSADTIGRLVARVRGSDRTFGMAISQTDRLSGHVEMRDHRVMGVIQQRLHPTEVPISGPKDVGVYVFPNSEEFRECLLETRNGNVRGEFMFADVVGQLVERGWTIHYEWESGNHTQTANTSGDLLRLTAGSNYASRTPRQCLDALENELGLRIDSIEKLEHLNTDFEAYSGPVMLYQRWNQLWR